VALTEAWVVEAALPEAPLFAAFDDCREETAGQLPSSRSAVTSSVLFACETIPRTFLVLLGVQKIRTRKTPNIRTRDRAAHQRGRASRNSKP
jgi:hypothetical protein